MISRALNGAVGQGLMRIYAGPANEARSIAKSGLCYALVLGEIPVDRFTSICTCLVIAALLMAAPATASSQSQPDGFEPFSFALLGDPQIGYGPGGEYADARSLQKIVESINARRLPLIIIPGDLVQSRSWWQRWTFARVQRQIASHVVLTAGNHDVVDTASLLAFRTEHGSDYYNYTFNNCSFVVIDSETAREPTLNPDEFTRQWTWLEATLAAQQRASRTHVVLITHRPPFVEKETESADDRNWPRETRSRLLNLARRYGVRWILAGHLHRTLIASTEDGLRVVVVAGSASSFDHSPIGYQLFQVDRDHLLNQWVTVAAAPPPPFVVPGFHEWTPRLFQFSIRHWLFTLAYVATAMVALRAARVTRTQHDKRQRSSSRLWVAIAVLLFAFGANMQLDFDEFLRDSGRIAAKLLGIYPLRHVITGTALAALAASGGLILGLRYLDSPRNRPVTVALAMLTVPAAWFFLSAISHHDLGMLFDEAYWDLLTVAALTVICACALRSAVNGRRRDTKASVS